jgi:serine/threonine protein kinase
MIRFSCPHCAEPLEEAPENQGRESVCCHCSATFTVPETDDLSILGGIDPGELLARGLDSVPHPGPDHWQPPTAEALQRLIPQYEVETMIGRGGMGAVYKGHQKRLGRRVAIKLLPAELAGDSDFVARFEREAKTLAHLSHPGIVTVHDFGQTFENHLYFVMEFVDGTDLHHLIKTGGLNATQVLDIVGQVCEALQFAHTRGVVHRDIKPANILVTTDGKVKLADFGLARPMYAGENGFQTVTHVVMGTPDYMAPEQKRGEGDHRVDLYALGVTLYEMLCGRPPQGAWLPPSQRAPVDLRLDQVVIKAMQEEPGKRYQQASEVKSDLEKIQNSQVLMEPISHLAASPLTPEQVPLPTERLGKKKAAPVLQDPVPGTAARAAKEGDKPWRSGRVVTFSSASALALVAAGFWLASKSGKFVHHPEVPGQKVSATEAGNHSSPDAESPSGALDRVNAACAEWTKLPGWSDKRITQNERGDIHLDLKDLPIDSLAPLANCRGASFGRIDLGNNQVSDLGPLAGHSLETLSLDRINRYRDFTPLLSCPNLRVLEHSGVRWPDFSLQLGVLREWKLEKIGGLAASDYWNYWDKAREWEPQINDLTEALQRKGLTSSPINGVLVPLVSFAPPDGLHLRLAGATFKDISVLIGHPVRILDTTRSEITDISAAATLPLREVYLGGSDGKVTDVSSLAYCADLEMIELSTGVTDPEPLRRLKHLQYISYRFDKEKQRPAQTAEEFWQEVDSKGR